MLHTCYISSTRYIKNQRFKNYKIGIVKKANKQDIRYYSTDSNGQDNIQLPLQ